MMNYNHPFYLITPSPWPLMCAINLMNLMLMTINFIYSLMNNMYMFIYLLCFMNLILSSIQWWRDIIRESTYQGNHTNLILKMLKFSMMLFIISELFFFISFFWTYFHSAISPSMEIGLKWPPFNINIFNPYDIPLLNSIILISSGFTITLAHHALLNMKMNIFKYNLFITIILGLYFSMFQYIEYKESSFTINDSIYGSIFFMATGFHGLHVMIGILMFISCIMRLMLNHFSNIHHFNFEAALWYWHFVDVVWLFLYCFFYWWIF
uniref:cytochrome c oxidase subunit III n=1 Tax=Tetrapedia diversipes TaxID=889126 RepID=UPI001EF9F3BC|nr:cytochrome c oxidase subunit III [Tetrapedia diversipes]UKG21058.1 cytochrome c oxidase subunit III [Tetrapedia diversipes]